MSQFAHSQSSFINTIASLQAQNPQSSAEAGQWPRNMQKSSSIPDLPVAHLRASNGNHLPKR